MGNRERIERRSRSPRSRNGRRHGQQKNQHEVEPVPPWHKEKRFEPERAKDSGASRNRDRCINDIKDLYRRFNADKLKEIDRILEKYSGAENELLQALKEKYVGK